tara:strand:- start:590 stop:850 length:261 start_codon:yes stop_codon:yes gene_type:complete
MDTYTNEYSHSKDRAQELETMLAQKDKVIDDIRAVVKSLEDENFKLRKQVRELVLNHKNQNKLTKLGKMIAKKAREYKLQSPIIKK